MRIRNTAFYLAILITLFRAEGAPTADAARPVLAIYTQSFRRASTDREPQVMAALWADGRIVWSASLTNGGPPYQQGTFPPEQLAKLLDRLEQRGAFTNKAMAQPWYGPDAAYTTVAINDGQRRLTMRSWHESYEQNTNIVALASGLSPLRGRDRASLLQSQPADYRNFREAWAEVRRAVAAMVPQTGEPYTAPIPIDRT